MTDHEWFCDNLVAYCVGGLPGDACRRLERHAAECGACAQELARWRLFDQGLGRLCAPVHFAADWDERVQARWQVTQRPPRRWSAAARWLGAAAALLFVGALGAAVMTVANQGLLAFPGAENEQAVVFEPSGAFVDSGLGVDPSAHTSVAGRLEGIAALAQKSERSQEAGRNWYENGRHDLAEKKESLQVSTLSSIQHKLGDTRAAATPEHRVSLTDSVQPNSPPVAVNGTALSDGVTERLDDLQQSHGTVWKEGFTAGIELNGWDRPAFSPDGKQAATGAGGAANVWSAAAEKSSAGAPFGKKSDEEIKALVTTIKESLTGKQMLGAVNHPVMGVPPAAELPRPKSAETASSLSLSTTYYNPAAPGTKHGLPGTDGATFGFGVDKQRGMMKQSESTQKLAAEQAAKFKEEAKAGAEQEKERQESLPNDTTGKAMVGDLLRGVSVAQAPAVVPQPKQLEPATQRKIIRTGEMEFEVDDFEASVVKINKLLDAIQGAFQATKNSDKLPNGKVKGAVVVRMPPEHLDKFTLDLRGSLAKTGELKTQRIGSQDVSKQYTDIESRLRAARIMEERLINIIKTGKGEVKDLIAAEAQLGVWRTKIEEMEGEIRYYNNQIGLSTLTINLVEKEIRTAATMVVAEKVTMKIEADDVDKALQSALAAVAEAKGRVTKSDLKLHAAGQVEALLHFEVAPAAAGAVKGKLAALGNVTHHDAQRTQTAEGGAAPVSDTIKSRTNDVQFDVTLYNVANIQPREAFHLTVAVPDVPGEYNKLLEAVTQAKGQVRVSQLDEKDKSNFNATLEFDVPSDKRAAFDKQLLGLGEVVSRNTTRAGATMTATDRKVGYRLLLKSVTSIPPRETFLAQAYSLDVPAAYKKLQEAVVQAKGHVRTGQLNEQDKNNINAQFDFDVPTGQHAAVEKLLEELADVHSRTTNRLQPSEIATDRKVGYRLTLTGRIPPRETVVLVLEVKEVEKVAAQLAASARAVKGKVTESKMSQDAAGRAIGTQHFEVPLAAKDGLLKEIRGIGAVRGQDASQNLQAPESKLATAVIGVRLLNANPIVPSDEGVWPQVRMSLSYAFRLLSLSLMFLIVGISVLLPWALVVWIGVRLVRRMRKGQATA